MPKARAEKQSLVAVLGARLRDAFGYWERRRIVYNGVLAVLVVACWGVEIALARPIGWLGAAVVLMFFAAIANALYCVAYPIDLVFQSTPWQSSWRRFRWLLFVSGTGLASVLALWIMLRPGMA